MTIEKAMRTYRLPNPTTPEDLENRWSKILTLRMNMLRRRQKRARRVWG